jgi:hypothetical protein
VSVVVGALPSSGSDQVDAIVGFALCLLAAAVSVWLVAMGLFSWKSLVAVLAAASLVAIGLSWLGLQAPAAPFKVLCGAAAGTLLGRQFLHPRWLLIGAVVALAVDLWSVFRGPTRLVMEHVPRTLDFLLVQFPLLGEAQVGFGLGISDFVFLALFAAGSSRCGLRARTAFGAMLSGILLTVVMAVALDRALPALPLLCLGFILANADRFVRSDSCCTQD